MNMTSRRNNRAGVCAGGDGNQAEASNDADYASGGSEGDDDEATLEEEEALAATDGLDYKVCGHAEHCCVLHGLHSNRHMCVISCGCRR